MANGKRYYWLKFREDFFDSKRIKKLRKMAGGDTYLVIYLKMQLKALRTDGVLQYTGIEESVADEIALDIDEEPENVKVVLAYLMANDLCECSDNINYFLPYVARNTGSETAGTQRWRDWKNKKVLESNTTPTLCQHFANAEKEIEKDIELEKEKDNYLDDEDDRVLTCARAREDDEIEAKYREAESTIRHSFLDCVGREPLPTELECISRFAVLWPSGVLVDEAIYRAAARGVKSIAPYVQKILEEWNNAKVTNRKELMEFDKQYGN